MSADEPVLRVVNPDATPEEIAALVAVFSAMGSGAAAVTKPRSAWASVERRLRRLPAHGVGAWKASGLPH
ncbi:MAG TPA: acyl-CoA carboxylase subunit epsilon [Marmoricola sp.]